MSSCSRYTTSFRFGSRFDRQDLPIPKRSPLRFTHSLNADVSENTLPFVSQSINNFSDYDISQRHDWECPSLSPHVLLVRNNVDARPTRCNAALNADDTALVEELGLRTRYTVW